MRKIDVIYQLAISVALLLLVGCAEDVDLQPVSTSHPELIGQGVNFNTSYADPFATRITYRHDGSFNEEEIMTIYRQYSNDFGQTFDADSAFRVYWLKTQYATGTTFALETNWLPKAGEIGYDPADKTTTPHTPEKHYNPQTEADSLTWDNGKTVRFRGWSRSNLDNCIPRSATEKNRYYPDYCIAEWVTVSGPTINVPLTLKHQGCRIGFIAKAGNELCKAEVCTDWHDYMWPDNADTNANDESAQEHGKTEAQAIAEANEVIAAYNRMCMPAGVDIAHSLLNTMTQQLYDPKKFDSNQPSTLPETDFSTIHNKTEADGIVKFGKKTPDQIRDEVQRPVFCSNDGRLYMVTIPYDMSNDATTKGETLKLPACTRFRLYLYDVNDGDKADTHDYEAQYHILRLSDVKKWNTNVSLFPEGLVLIPGNSYMFSVGYHYDHLTVTPADNFSWVHQDAENETGICGDETHTLESNLEPYKWWKDAIKNAIPKNINESFEPEFHITTRAEFLEFIDLVNGTNKVNGQNYKTSGLTQVLRPEKTYDKDHLAEKSDYRWYPSQYVVDGKIQRGHEADSVTHAAAIADGYIFYEHYHPANADQAAYSLEDYLRGPYSFFDEDLNRHFVVYLDNDLDFYDWLLTPIGNESVELGATGSHPFRGVFDGQNNTLKNVYFNGSYMFKHCFDAAIRNLNIETVHDFKLVHTAQAANNRTGYGAYIVGVSIKAPSSGNPIATTLLGSSYVVGCIYEGHATGAMVGEANNLYMYGNMMAAEGIPSGQGALLGRYASGASSFFAPQSSAKLTWGRFMANYYDTELSPGTTAVGGVADAYRPQEYIRGAHSYILKAKNDNLLSDEVDYEEKIKPNPLMVEGYYGLAPWKAMNYAIYQYNLVGAQVKDAHNCTGHFVNDNVGYAHTYPRLVSGAPTLPQDENWNVLEQNN